MKSSAIRLVFTGAFVPVWLRLTVILRYSEDLAHCGIPVDSSEYLRMTGAALAQQA